VNHDSSLTPTSSAQLAAKHDGIVNILAARSDPFAA
jgi:hypothetical protein